MLEAISKRRSIRHYENRPVEEEKIQEILRAAMASPSAMNQRPWEFYVIRDPELLKKLGEVTPYSKPIGEAPVGIAMMVRRDSLCPAYQDIDCGIASENLMLEATAQGLGSVMLGIAPKEEREKAVEALLDAPKELRAFALFALGYPAYEPKPRETFELDRVRFVG